MKPTALWAIPVSNLAGVARHVLDVGGNGLPGWDLVVLCAPGPLAEAARARGIEVCAGPFGRESGRVPSVSTLRRAIREIRPEVVHTHLAYADVVAAIVGPGRGARLIATEHGIATIDVVHHGSQVMSQVMAAVHRARQYRVDGMIAVSRATLEAVRTKWHPRASMPTEVIPNGMDRLPDPDHPAAPGLRIGAVCRLAPEKDLGALIDAFAIIVKAHPEARLTLAGEGVSKEFLMARTRQLGLDDVVDFPGYVPAPDMLGRLDVVAMPSVFENCSYTLLEALASECGVVATAVGGNPELLPPDSLVERGDIEGLAEVIVRQALHPETRPHLADDWPTVADMCDRIVAFYERVAG